MAEERRPLEVQRARAALGAAAAELDALADRLAADGRGDEAEIIRAGVLMAHDPVLVDDVERAVLDGRRAPAALEAATARHAAAIAALGDATLAARAEDVRSLGRRAVRLAEPGAGAAARRRDRFARRHGARRRRARAGRRGRARARGGGARARRGRPDRARRRGRARARAADGRRARPRGAGAPPGEPLVVDGGEGIAVLAPGATRAHAPPPRRRTPAAPSASGGSPTATCPP